MGKIIFIGGYGRSGKSSTLEILKSLDIPCYSTSVLLHQTYRRLVEAKLKSFKLDFNMYDGNNKAEIRQELITLAEDVLVPTFGREIFAHTVIRQANLDPVPIVAVETVGGEEFRLGLEVIEKEYVCWNIRRNSELKGVDLRKLLVKGVDIWNNGSISDLSGRIERELSWMKWCNND
jgi:NADPH-dependent 7-cyano-7-deazaguanine reductase QueF-like protein